MFSWSCFQGKLFGQLVAVAAQDGADLLEAVQALAVGDPAGGVESLGGVFAAEIEQAEAEAIGLLGMGFDLQLRADPRQHLGADRLCPVL